MIAYLSGRPLITQSTTAIVCNGVGYGVNVTSSTKAKLASISEVNLFIHSHIKEDAFELYGFLTEEEKLLFLRLIDVDGVGPKTALSIMDRGVVEIVSAVRAANTSFFQSIPRVGKKSAQKIIIELKSKLGGEELSLTEPVGKAKEAIEALVGLGFSDSESKKVIEAMDTENIRLEDLVTAGIKQMTAK
jgi:holliday junction DNA helicase RuvA